MRGKARKSTVSENRRVVLPKAPAKTWAKAVGIEVQTLIRRLRAAGFEPGPGKVWSAREVVSAMTGDKSAALARKALADAEMAEHELRVATRDVIPFEEAADYVRRTFAPVREKAMGLPSTMAAQVNPTDPAHARRHLEQWVEEFLKHCRERMPEKGSEGEKSE